MRMDKESGSSALITIAILLTAIAVFTIGTILLVSSFKAQANEVKNDTLNLSGINYSSEIYNGTESTLDTIAETSPNLVWIIVIFLIIAFLTMAFALFGRR